MHSKEKEMIIWAVVGMIIFELLKVGQSGLTENKIILQKKEFLVTQMNAVADSGCSHMSQAIHMNGGIIDDIEPQVIIPQEAIIDVGKIDQALLDKLKYEVASGKEIHNDFMGNDKITMGKAEN